LVFDSCDLVTPVLGLGLNDADRTAIDEKDVVSRTRVGRVFSNGDAESGSKA
jgi:hypothetical protein